MRDRESLDPPPFTQQQASRRSAWATVAAPPTDTLPALPAPSWATPAELASAPTYRRGLPPVPTTYGDLDRVLGGGLRPECVYVLAGRTGSAKSTLAANIVRRVALDGLPVLYLKLEESTTEALWRLHAAAAQVDFRVLLDGAERADDEDRRKLADSWDLLRDLPIRLSGARRLGEVERVCREHVAAGGGLVVLDQLSQVQVPGADVGYERATVASNTLRVLARELHVPILAVSQVNRPAAKGKEHLSCHDLRDSGEIENDAAAVMLIDGVRKPEGPHYAGAELVLYLQLLVGKNRYGPTTDPERPIELLWWPRQCRIEGAALDLEGLES